MEKKRLLTFCSRTIKILNTFMILSLHYDDPRIRSFLRKSIIVILIIVIDYSNIVDYSKIALMFNRKLNPLCRLEEILVYLAGHGSKNSKF